jgi:DNA-directed RNA polymerase specialized sigma24 family protein
MRYNSYPPQLYDIEALRRRDRQAWEYLYEAQWGPLCAFSRAQLAKHHPCEIAPEEIVQEVFCRAYSEIKRFRGEARLETWLRSIALRVVTAEGWEHHPERRPRAAP